MKGTRQGQIGDWIIRNANGKLDVCRADEFSKKYAPWEASVLPFGKPPRGSELTVERDQITALVGDALSANQLADHMVRNTNERK